MNNRTAQFETIHRMPASAESFVTFWSDLYSYPNAELYELNIRQPLTEERVWALYKWKNGGDISAKKRQSVASIYVRALNDGPPELRTITDGRRYLSTIAGGGIWGIFWLHCINPDLFPIFDQHTYRAMAKLSVLEPKEIPADRDAKLAAYFDQYMVFVSDSFHRAELTSVDRALFTYGRFLKSQYFRA